MSQVALDQAMALHQAGKLAEAEPHYVRFLLMQPLNARAQFLLGMLRYEMGRDSEAIAPLNAALSADPDMIDALMLRGELLFLAGRRADALTDFTRVTLRDPGNAGGWRNRGAALESAGRFDEAAENFAKAYAIQPDPAVLYRRALALRTAGNPAEALKALDQILAQAPDIYEVWRSRAAVLDDLKDFPEALVSYDRAVALQPGDAESWVARGIVLNALDRPNDAVQSYTRAIALNPDHAEALNLRGRAWRKLQLSEQALDDFERSLEIRPDDPETLNAYGAALSEDQQMDKAVAVFQRHAQVVYGDVPLEAPDDGPVKQKHDAEQRAYLAEQGIPYTGGLLLGDGTRVAGKAINPANRETVEAAWRASGDQIVVIDNVLTDEALEKLRRYCWGSTIWRKAYRKGYLGALPESGLACPLIAQIADEMRDTFPAIFKDYGLLTHWSFKYEAQLDGIPIHADQAAVNVNIWITPDEANHLPEAGGLIIWDKAAPDDWNAMAYNANVEASRKFLADVGAQAITVPYRSNRAAIFDSDLFHEGDRIDFEEGYTNRRINVTFLYGRRTPDGH